VHHVLFELAVVGWIMVAWERGEWLVVVGFHLLCRMAQEADDLASRIAVIEARHAVD
jgi:hypothetical protein